VSSWFKIVFVKEPSVKYFKKIPKTVFQLGLVSLFNDLAKEMIYPVVPLFLTSVLGAGPVALGLV